MVLSTSFLELKTDLVVQQYDDNAVVLALFQLMFHTLYLDLYETLVNFQVFQGNWSFAAFYMDFSNISEKVSFVLMLKWTFFTGSTT